MSARLWQRAVPVIAMSLFLMPLAACGEADQDPPVWEAGSPTTASELPTEAAPPPSPVTPSPTAASPTPKASATPRPSASRTTKPPAIGTARVSVVRTAAGQGARTLSVEGDGRWSYLAGTRDDNGTLNQSQRERLQALLADPKLDAEARERDRPRCRDAASYALNTGSTTVLWQACSNGAPATATAIVRLLEGATPL
ncbi:hypothetical protein [Micromonospora sp. NBC_01796]|uniref:hypothetical protein n=1 Tax=Micromonospora sp. NBC_01796 TaxID=2975987 RepID=UPI002DD94845|nr:hypothetical protein [Micromonospora sp. NBC_01796]WSA89005.1 hypothetical protein OIE47_16105 [Micromonospora sp. NBC_01796]